MCLLQRSGYPCASNQVVGCRNTTSGIKSSVRGVRWLTRIDQEGLFVVRFSGRSRCFCLGYQSSTTKDLVYTVWVSRLTNTIEATGYRLKGFVVFCFLIGKEEDVENKGLIYF